MQTFTKLAIPDFIAKGTSQVADLAEKAAFPEDALYRVLRVLEMAGIVRETSSRSFALTNAGSLLRTDAQGSMRDIIQYMTDPLALQSVCQLHRQSATGADAVRRCIR